jgi:serine protease AprX
VSARSERSEPRSANRGGTIARSAVVLAGAVLATTAFGAMPAAAATTGTTVTAGTDLARQIGAAAAWDLGLSGRGVGVALIDTGIAPVPGLPPTRMVNGPDLSFESQTPTLRYLDSNGHGTHLAGIIAGRDKSAGYRGIASGATLTSVKVASGTGAADASQVMAAVDWVVQHRNDDRQNPIRVINLAYGTNSTQTYQSDPLAFAVENAYRAGIVVVVAGGNGGQNSTRLTNPAIDPFVVSVGAVAADATATTADDTLSTFSSGSIGRKVDIAAPGESIVSLRDPGSFVDANYPAARVGTRLFRGSGTSQAAAVVSGSVALLLQQRPWLNPDQVKSILKRSATPLGGAGGSGNVGELNVARALVTDGRSNGQEFAHGRGTGSLEAARGDSHVVDGDQVLAGERDIFGPFDTTVWAAVSASGTAWRGGLWLGRRFAGDGWTGTSWAGRTWGAATWPGLSWSGQPWAPADWAGRYWNAGSWAGRYWAGDSWTGRYWASDTWTGRYWASFGWASVGWTA